MKIFVPDAVLEPENNLSVQGDSCVDVILDWGMKETVYSKDSFHRDPLDLIRFDMVPDRW